MSLFFASCINSTETTEIYHRANHRHPHLFINYRTKHVSVFWYCIRQEKLCSQCFDQNHYTTLEPVIMKLYHIKKGNTFTYAPPIQSVYWNTDVNYSHKIVSRHFTFLIFDTQVTCTVTLYVTMYMYMYYMFKLTIQTEQNHPAMYYQAHNRCIVNTCRLESVGLGEDC